ncbi:TIGR03668 family PPOX class F420-dependent oxidoreductase [Georgenia alba]|uniref:TIGR03668 family PPOX class F420-dependent oxidoreductase n=1 Tax=Georgenia alba TaxID=2233858 RepID=A0ABW2QD70_9MICO
MRLGADACRQRLAGSRVAHLATADGAGVPHIVPVAFAVVPDAGAPAGAAIVTAVDHKPKTTTALKRLRNLADNPRAAVLVDHYDEDWTALWWVRADGTTTLEASGAGWAAARAALVEKYPQYRRRPPEGPVVHLRVARWTGWAASP